MPTINLPMKTAYRVSYIPIGGRKVREGVFSETVPVAVEVRDDIVPAVVLEGDDRDLVASDGLLYRDAGGRRTSLADFAELMDGDWQAMVRERYAPFVDNPWFADRSLVASHSREARVFDAPAMDTIGAREIVEEDRAHGLAMAQRRAGAFISDGVRVYSRVPAAPSVSVTVYDGQVSLSPNYSERSTASTSSLPSRAFRWGDNESILEFVRRKGLPEAGLDKRLEGFNDVTWTDAGLAVEDTTAWWTVWSAARLTRYPEEGSSQSSFMSEDITLIRCLMDLAEIVRHDDTMLISARDARSRADRALPVMEELSAMLGRERPVLRGVLGFIADEYRNETMKLDFDGLTLPGM